MTDLTDFIRTGAQFMAADRSDLYDQDTAIEELFKVVDGLRDNYDAPVSIVGFGGYVVVRYYHGDNLEEFTLTKKISGYMHSPNDEYFSAFGYSDEVDLPHIRDVDLENPE